MIDIPPQILDLHFCQSLVEITCRSEMCAKSEFAAPADVSPGTSLLDSGEPLGEGKREVESRWYFKFESLVYVAPSAAKLDWRNPLGKGPRIFVDWCG
jgi:hypothetical protein